MPRGAPKGNQYAKKTTCERGITCSYYLDAYEYDFLKKALDLDGVAPTDEAVRGRAKNIMKDALSAEMRRVWGLLAR